MSFLMNLFKSAIGFVSGSGIPWWAFLLVGLAPSAFLAVDDFKMRGRLADCRQERIEDARAVTRQLLQDLSNVNDAATRASASIQAIRESSNAVREDLRNAHVTCDLEPVRDRLQQHINEVRQDGESAVAP